MYKDGCHRKCLRMKSQFRICVIYGRRLKLIVFICDENDGVSTSFTQLESEKPRLLPILVEIG